MAGVSSDININVKANVKGATSQINAAGDAVRDFGKRTQTANQNVKVFGKNLTGAGGANKFLRSGMQQAGYQFGDFAVQVGGGTNALQAFGQQAPQLLQIFGPLGSIIGAGVAIFAAVGVAIMKTTDSVKKSKDAIEALVDSTNRIKASASALAATYNLELAEGLKAAKNEFGELDAEVVKLIASNKKLLEQKLSKDILDTGDSINETIPAFQEYLRLSVKIQNGAERLGKAATLGAINRAKEILAELREELKEMPKGVEGGVWAMKRLSIALRTSDFDWAVFEINGLVEQLALLGDETLEQRLKLEKFSMSILQARKSVEDAKLSISEFVPELEDMGEEFGMSIAVTKDLSWMVGRLARDYGDLNTAIETFSMDGSELAPLGEALAIQRKINELLKQELTLAEATEQATRLISGDRKANLVQFQNELAAQKLITDELTKQAKVRKPEDMGGLGTGAIPIPQASPVTQDYLKALGKIDLQIAQITEKQRLMNELGLSETVAQQAAKIATTLQLTDEQFALLVERLKKLEDSSQEAGKELKDAFDKISSSFKSAFKSVIDGTKSVSEAFRDMMGEILSSLMDKSIDAALDGLFDKLGGAGGGGGGGGGDGLWGLLEKGFSYLGGLLSGPSTSGYNAGGMAAPTGPGGLIQPLAKGGYASATRPFLVGEEGPELMIPNASGRVVPNDELGGSGSQINQTFNVSTGVQQTVRAEIQSLMPQIAAASTQAVLDARRRGGSFAGAFA